MDVLPLIERLGRKGATQFANWNPSLFRDYCQALLSGNAVAEPTVDAAVAELLCEGVGRGYLTASMQDGSTNLMEHCFRNWLPARLAGVAADRRLPILADTWNLLEGLLSEPRWVNAYVM